MVTSRIEPHIMVDSVNQSDHSYHISNNIRWILLLSMFVEKPFLYITVNWTQCCSFFSGYVRYDEMPTLGSQESLKSKCEYRYKLHLDRFQWPYYAEFWLYSKMMASKSIFYGNCFLLFYSSFSEIYGWKIFSKKVSICHCYPPKRHISRTSIVS